MRRRRQSDSPKDEPASPRKELLHPGGAIRAKARGSRDLKLFSLLSQPVVAIVVAVAIGLGMGLMHRRQKVDLADSIAALLLRNGGSDRGGPTPSLNDKKAAAGPAAGAAAGLAGPILVQVHSNGESQPRANVTLTPEAHRSLSDMRQAVGAVLPACAAGDCRVFDQYGYEVKALSALQEDQRLFLVLPRRHFIWPAFHVGYRTEVPGVASAHPSKPIVLETLSDSPRVFMVENFFDEQDADDLIEFTLGIDDDVFGLKRSTTGATGDEVSFHRTSENAFDTHSPVAMKLKRRVFDLLGIRPYNEQMADGLQVLRYNVSKAYVAHLDYLEQSDQVDHEFDSSKDDGTNRFATVLLYLSDVEAGGQTVFPKADRLDGPPLSEQEGLQLAEARGWTKDLQRGSWQYSMMGSCASKLAVAPKKAKAVLFYSQHPDGRVDERSLHGACPVVKGQKWAANLWVWNGPRYGYNPRSKKGSGQASDSDKLQVEFSSAVDAELYWRDDHRKDTFWSKLGPGHPPQHVQTYPGHVWVVKPPGGGKDLHTWRMKSDKGAADGMLRFVYDPKRQGQGQGQGA